MKNSKERKCMQSKTAQLQPGLETDFEDKAFPYVPSKLYSQCGRIKSLLIPSSSSGSINEELSQVLHTLQMNLQMTKRHLQLGNLPRNFKKEQAQVEKQRIEKQKEEWRAILKSLDEEGKGSSHSSGIIGIINKKNSTKLNRLHWVGFSSVRYQQGANEDEIMLSSFHD
ncbi:hypothetical protein EI555_006955 [Monodon monoceros]|uniref:Uncharacterized protein n=1 Tax=Monodon monoceros TaxID=40151 RepID=A0A4U1EWG9_MONMO|nr:hypothetical protein EI555_006955 [Monodon monoceros]